MESDGFVWVCEKGDVSSVYHHLKKREKKVLTCVDKGIEAAAKNGHLEILWMFIGLMSKRVVHLWSLDRAIEHACENGHLEVVRFLMNSGKVDPALWDNSPIRLACTYGHLEIVQLLLTDSRVVKSLTESHLMATSARCGYIEIVDYLLGHTKLLPEAFDVEVAIEYGHIEIAKIFLQSMTVDLEMCQSIFHSAIENNCEEIAKLLFSDTLKVSYEVLVEKEFCRACILSDIDKVNQYLQSQAVKPSTLKNMAMVWVVLYGSLQLRDILLRDPRFDPSDGSNFAIRYASSRGFAETVKLLLNDPRVDPSADCNLAIQLAAENGHAEVVKILLEDDRVDPFAGHNYAMEAASSNGHTEVVQLLRSQRESTEDSSSSDELEDILCGKKSPPLTLSADDEIVQRLLKRMRKS